MLKRKFLLKLLTLAVVIWIGAAQAQATLFAETFNSVSPITSISDSYAQIAGNSIIVSASRNFNFVELADGISWKFW